MKLPKQHSGRDDDDDANDVDDNQRADVQIADTLADTLLLQMIRVVNLIKSLPLTTHCQHGLIQSDRARFKKQKSSAGKGGVAVRNQPLFT